jgi:hypothetical protein
MPMPPPPLPSSETMTGRERNRPRDDGVPQREGQAPQQRKRRHEASALDDRHHDDDHHDDGSQPQRPRLLSPSPRSSPPSFRFLPFHLGLLEHLHRGDGGGMMGRSPATAAAAEEEEDNDIGEDLARVRGHLRSRPGLLALRVEAGAAAAAHRVGGRFLREPGRRQQRRPRRGARGDEGAFREEWEEHGTPGRGDRSRGPPRGSKRSRLDPSHSAGLGETTAPSSPFGVVEHLLGLRSRAASEAAGRRNRDEGALALREACRRRVRQLEEERRALEGRADERARRLVADLLSGTAAGGGAGIAVPPSLDHPTGLASDDGDRSELAAAACRLRLWTLLAGDVEMLLAGPGAPEE